MRLDGHSYRAYKHAPKTLVEVLQGARAHGDLEFMVYEGQRYTYAQFFQQVDALAASLQADFGVAKGDRVAIAMRNNPQWVIGYAAVTLIGASWCRSTAGAKPRSCATRWRIPAACCWCVMSPGWL